MRFLISFSISVTIALASFGLVVLTIRKPWLKSVSLRGVFSYIILYAFLVTYILSAVILLLPQSIRSMLSQTNPLLLITIFLLACSISVVTSLVLMNNTREIPPFIAVLGTCTAHIFSIALIGFIVLILGSTTNEMNSIRQIVLASATTGIVFTVIHQILFILDESKLKLYINYELFKRFEKYPNHYPYIRKSIVNAWSAISQDMKYLNMAYEYEKLRNRISTSFRASSNVVDFFKDRLGEHLRGIEIHDESGMDTAIRVIRKLAIYYPKCKSKKGDSFKVKRQIMHDLVLACNVLFTEAVEWDEIGATKTQNWEVLHALRILMNLFTETLPTGDFDVISSVYRMVYTTLLRHHDTLNKVLFSEAVIDDVSLLEWMQALMTEHLFRLKNQGDEDWQIYLRLISYSSIIRICTGRIDKLLVYLQDVGEDKHIETRCYKLMEILTEQIHMLSLSDHEYHRHVTIALYFLLACFSKYKFSKTNAEDQIGKKFWKKLETQTRFMIKYHIGSSKHKGLDFFTGYVCLLQFLRYNPIPLIPWNLQSYTFIEIESLMDDLTNYFEKYMIYIDPNISQSEREFITSNLKEPKWIFFNSPTVTLEMLQVYIDQIGENKGEATIPHIMILLL